MNTVKLPLHLREYEKKRVDKILFAHGLLYNEIISTLIKRIDIYHQSVDQVRENHTGKTGRLVRRKAYYSKLSILQKKYQLSKFDTMRLGASVWDKTNNALLTGKTVETVSQRAWTHCQGYLKKRNNKPGFKKPHHLSTIYGNGTRQNLRLSSQEINDLRELCSVKVLFSNQALNKKHYLSLKINWHKLSQPRREWLIDNWPKIKQVGIKKDYIRGEEKHYLLITLDCPAYRNKETEKRLRNKTGQSLAIDTGPKSSKAFNSKGESRVFQVSKREQVRLKQTAKQLTQSQRALDRSNRANSPQSYQKDGTLAKGAKLDNKSRHALRLKQRIKELHRKQAAQRKEAVLKLAKELTSKYDTVLMEACSYKAWQAYYGKTIKYHTPGLFQHLLGKELDRHGKSLKLLPLNYAFSQACLCGQKVKKPLSLREHSCSNQVCPTYQKTYQRDDFSARLMLLTNLYNLSPEDLHSGKLASMLTDRRYSPASKANIETLLNLSDSEHYSKKQKPRVNCPSQTKVKLKCN
jgi:putative transposase